MTEPTGPTEPIALFGGVYSNHLALAAVLEDARSQGVKDIYCLGDLGAFGPHPDRVFPLLVEHNVRTVQGNYDHSIGHRRNDCACGYTDPSDNHFARLSYEYTFANTSDRWKDWLRDLPPSLDIEFAGRAVHLCHGSSRQTNEFLWESTSPDPFLRRLFEHTGSTVIACTHTGLHWQRSVRGGMQGNVHGDMPGAGSEHLLLNVGVIGRPGNDGTTDVGYMLLSADDTTPTGLRADYRRVPYDHTTLAKEMRAEGLPHQFIETIESGWWTSCLEILPGKERARGRF